MGKRTIFTEEADEILKANYLTTTTAEIMELLPAYSRDTIHARARRFHALRRPERKKTLPPRLELRKYSEADDAYIKAHYATDNNKDIAKYLGKTMKQISNRGIVLGLKKDKSIKRRIAKQKSEEREARAKLKELIKTPTRETKTRVNRIIKAKAEKAKAAGKEPKIFPMRVIDTAGLRKIKIGKLEITLKPHADEAEVRLKYAAYA